ncbi:MAG: hypothetical protein OFPI_43080 [Osedax symbiont Rs2]|nr:MAG: hypothetical protein OFPI_43080 [Osedax symbiont Rs2]
MISQLANTAIRIPCSNCNCKTIKSMKWIKTHDAVACKCEPNISLNTEQLKSEIARDESSFAALNLQV